MPVDPIIVGAGIGAASDLVGGFLGRESVEKQQKQNLAAQKEFAQHGIRWRVEDARAAGLHPLFALGASTSGPTIPIMEDPLARSLGSAGQQIGRAVAATAPKSASAAEQMALQVAGSQIARNYAEAAMFDSQAARNYQQAGVSAGVPNPSPAGLVPSPAQIADAGTSPRAISVVPSQTIAHSKNDPGIEAAVGTGMKWFNMPGKGVAGGSRRVLLPSANSFGEALESVSESMVLAWIVARENMRENPNFLWDNAHWFPYGKELIQKYMPRMPPARHDWSWAQQLSEDKIAEDFRRRNSWWQNRWKR